MLYKCSRCGEDVTAPARHNGKVYGYSCYKVVTGGKRITKKAKLSGIWVPADNVKIEGNEIIAEFGGKRFKEFHISGGAPAMQAQHITEDGYLCIFREGREVWHGIYLCHRIRAKGKIDPKFVYVSRIVDGKRKRVKLYEF